MGRVGQAGAGPLPLQQEAVGGRVKAATAAAVGVLKVTHESSDAVGPAQHRRGPSSLLLLLPAAVAGMLLLLLM